MIFQRILSVPGGKIGFGRSCGNFHDSLQDNGRFRSAHF